MFHDETSLAANIFLQRVLRVTSSASDPVIMRTILSNVRFDTFYSKNATFNNFLQKLIIYSQDMRPLMNRLTADLLNNQALRQLFAFIQNEGLIKDEEIEKFTPYLQLHLNLIYLFEAFTVMMANVRTFTKEIYRHITVSRNHKHTGDPFYNFINAPSQVSLFLRLKMISIDPAALNVMLRHKKNSIYMTQSDVNRFIEKNRLSGINASSLAPFTLNEESTENIANMDVNILEAAWEDVVHNQHGGKQNAAAGLGLIAIMEKKEYKSLNTLSTYVLPQGVTPDENLQYPVIPALELPGEENVLSQFKIDPYWRDLYCSWNLCFCIANLASGFVPVKLLLPSVLSARPENFKETRVLSLFLMGNLFSTENLANSAFFQPPCALKNASIILSEWGRINYNYAESLMKIECGDEQTSLHDLYQSVFGSYPTLNLVGNLFSFFKKSSDYRLCYHPQNQDRNHTEVFDSPDGCESTFSME